MMAELGWTAVRVRDMTRGGYLEQVRGYCRNIGQGVGPLRWIKNVLLLAMLWFDWVERQWKKKVAISRAVSCENAPTETP